jgi:hypothetical protein
LNLSNGFIAHYDKWGFTDYYHGSGSFKRDILTNQRNNRWWNFRPGERGYKYYLQKKRICNAVYDCLKNNIEYGSEGNIESRRGV